MSASVGKAFPSRRPDGPWRTPRVQVEKLKEPPLSQFPESVIYPLGNLCCGKDTTPT